MESEQEEEVGHMVKLGGDTVQRWSYLEGVVEGWVWLAGAYRKRGGDIRHGRMYLKEKRQEDGECTGKEGGHTGQGEESE